MATVEETAKEIVQRYTDEGYNQANPEVIADCVAEDVIMHGLHGVEGPLQGREAYLEWGAELLKAVPDAHVETDDLIVDGNKVAALWTISGTQEGELAGIPATGKSFEMEALSLFRIEDGVIAEKWYRPDELGMLQQLGVMD